MESSSAQLDQGEVGKAALPTPKGDGYRLERTVWIVMLLLPLLAYCVVAVLAFSIKPTPITTGDALYDKYLAWVADDLVDSYRGSFAEPYGSRWGLPDYEVDLDPFADWEAEFGDDPRYWMLRYRYSKGTRIGEWGISEPDVNHLEKAYKLGVVDGAILLILLKDMDSYYSNESNYASRNNPNTLNSRAEVVKYNRSEIDRQVGTQHTQLLAELLEVAENESVVHYYAALCDTQRGNYDAALLHLADGNMAPSNSSLIGFPVERLLSDLRTGNTLPDRLISGVIVIDETAQLLPGFIHSKDLVNLLVADAVNRDDRAGLDEIHTFASRYGSIGGGTVITFLVGTVLVGTIESEFGNYLGAALSAQELGNLSKVSSFKTQITNQIRAVGMYPPVPIPMGMPKILEVISAMKGVLSGGRSTYIEGYESMHDGYIQEQSTIVPPLRQLFLQLESFNYNTLEFE